MADEDVRIALDILKETDFRFNFTDAFRSVTSHENLERERLRPRLPLCAHGIGTNTACSG